MTKKSPAARERGRMGKQQKASVDPIPITPSCEQVHVAASSKVRQRTHGCARTDSALKADLRRLERERGCGAVGFEYDGRSARIRCGCPKNGDRDHTPDHPRILKAYAAARAARFERGERGDV